MQVGSPRYRTAGGIHRIPIDGLPGSLYLTGFSVVGPDPGAALDDVGALTLVCLIEADEIERRFPDFAGWLVEPEPHSALHHPTPDQGVVSDEAVVAVAAGVLERLRAGDGVMLHCGAGMGRTGTVAALVLMATGVGLDEALATIRSARPGAGPDGPDQLAQLRRLAARFPAGGARRLTRPGRDSLSHPLGMFGYMSGWIRGVRAEDKARVRDIEERVAELAGHLNALHGELAVLVGELHGLGGCGDLSAARWLGWRLGCSGRRRERWRPSLPGSRSCR